MNIFSRLKEGKLIIWFRNLLILVLSFFIFIGAIYFLFYLTSIPSTKQKREYKKREELREKIKGMVDCLVLEAGWQKRQAGSEEIYVPQIKILLTNKSSDSLKDVTIRAYFEVEGNRLCLDSAPIFKLDPGTYLELVLNCSESIGFGTIFKGLSLIQTAKKVSYEIFLSANNLYIPLIHGILEFKLLSPGNR